MNIKEIILSKLNTLLNEDGVSISKLPQKKVVDSDTAHNIGVAKSYSKNIDDKFRQLGVGVSDTIMLTPDILKNMGSFPIKFKLEKPTKFFDGNTNITGTAVVDKKYKGLRLNFTHNTGEKVIMDFNLNDLKTTIPQTDVTVNALREKIQYNVRFKGTNTKVVKIVFISLPKINDEDINNNQNDRFSLDHSINLTGELRTDGDLDFLGYTSLVDLNRLIRSGVVGMLSSSRQDTNTVKLTLRDGSVILLEPLSDYPDPNFVSNWVNRPVRIGDNAARKSDWKSVEGTATLKIKK